MKILTRLAVGCQLGHNPDRPKLGDEGLADGFRLDAQGRLWSSMPDGVCVLDPETKEVICQVRSPLMSSSSTLSSSATAAHAAASIEC